MRVGDLVRAQEGSIKGELGVVTRIDPVTHDLSLDQLPMFSADIFWCNGVRQDYVSTKYLEVVQND